MDRQSIDAKQAENPRPTMRGYWVIGAVALGLAIAVLPFDLVSANPNNLEYLPGDLQRFVSLSEIFAHGFGIGIVAIGIWLLASSKRRFIPRIVMCAVWPALGVHLVKLLFGRYRPIKYHDGLSNVNYPANLVDTWQGWLPNDQLNVVYASQSFPSGHTATVWGLAIGMSWVFPKGKWLFCFIAVLASIQRVSSFAHWPSDVFCGAAIAFVMAGAITGNWGLGYYFGLIENGCDRAGGLIPLRDKEIQIRNSA